jgi:hypothetical protein
MLSLHAGSEPISCELKKQMVNFGGWIHYFLPMQEQAIYRASSAPRLAGMGLN